MPSEGNPQNDELQPDLTETQAITNANDALGKTVFFVALENIDFRNTMLFIQLNSR